MPRGQAERLAPMARELLEAAGLTPGDLSAVAVCTGPGNFTGVRIGVAFARGLALSLGIPAVGVTRPEALAMAAAGPGRVAVTAAARRGEAVAQVFDAADGALPRPVSDLCQALPEQLVDRLAAAGPARVTGPAAAALAARLGAETGAPGDLADPADVARIAALRLGAGERPPRPAPVYLRPAEAAPPSEPPPALLSDGAA